MSEKKVQIPIPAGAVFITTIGAYSDYYVSRVLKALVEIDMDKEREKWLNNHPSQKRPYAFKEEVFLEDIITRKLAKPIEYYEVHFDDFGGSGIERF